MSYIRRAACAALLVPVMLFAALPASAGVGDLLVAPTRVILNGGRGTEIILDNIGEEVATASKFTSAPARPKRPRCSPGSSPTSAP